MAIARDGTLWFGRFHGEKQRHDWERIGLPANEAEVDSLIEVLGALLATHIRE
jgi:hypothetical protein